MSLRKNAAGEPPLRRLFFYNAGFLTQRRVRRILALSGWSLRIGRAGADDTVVVWGKSPTAHRGERFAARSGSALLRCEDTFLRSVMPGRAGSPPLGLLLDTRGVHFDSSAPSDLEHLLATHPLDDTALLDRARDGIVRLKRGQLSKYNAVLPDAPVPDPGYVLVVDQTRGDASIRHGAGSVALFNEMLAFAQIEHPGKTILIKTHPETRQGYRFGHYDTSHEDHRTHLLTNPVSPWPLLDGAVAVYAVSSQFGFEAILAGHRPRIFGQPFYGGWGLSDDENPVARRERRLTRAQIFAAAMILAPTWYDPFRDRLCSFEEAVGILEAEVFAWRRDRRGHVASGMRMWKRRPLQKVFGRHKTLVFQDDPTKATAHSAAMDRPLMVWAGRETPDHHGAPLLRIEDGFLRSRGLGAELVPPLSLVADDLGIYYDPTRPSRLEVLIAESAALKPTDLQRARALIDQIRRANLSKYNIGSATLPDLPEGPRILVPGQVEDDASIRLGAGEVRTNLGLLASARRHNPGATILFKPHPDVEAGLRAGAVSDAEAQRYADLVVTNADPTALLDQVDDLWTMTSLMGFEALLRGKSVVCLGAPFYAGWGLTRDLGSVPDRRLARPTIEHLAHAVLIGYPLYYDPVTNAPCPPEVVADRLAARRLPHPGVGNRMLAKAQGLVASRAHLWRRP